MSIWHWCKLVQVYSTAPGIAVDNDHDGDFLDLDNATLRYWQSIIPKPVSVTGYSYEIWYYLELIRTPRTSIGTFRFYSDNEQPDAPKNKVTVMAGTVVRTGTTPFGYATPVRTVSSYATTAVHSNYYGPSNTLSIGGSLTTIGDKSDWLVLQLKAEVGCGKIDKLYLPMHFYFTVS